MFLNDKKNYYKNRYKRFVFHCIYQILGDYNEDGSRIELQIDESKFGKRKYNRGHHVDGVWVIGEGEKTP